jgi:hypothetical protein
VLYTAGNAGNGASPQPDGVIIGTGAQIITPQNEPEAAQQPGTPTPVGSFSVTQLGDKIDKVGKDTNFRGLRSGASRPTSAWSPSTRRAATGCCSPRPTC